MTKRIVMDLGPGTGAQREPLEFEIKGVTRQGEEWSEVFSALPSIPAGVLATLGDGMFPASKLMEFVVSLVVPEDEERFLVLTIDKDRLINAHELAVLSSHLLQELTGRPTTPSVEFFDGAGNTGITSTDGSSSPALVLAASTDGNS